VAVARSAWFAGGPKPWRKYKYKNIEIYKNLKTFIPIPINWNKGFKVLY
jgi:hypothetical protein